MRLAKFLAILSLAPVTGCGPPAIEGGFDSGNPASRLYAIEYAAEQGDTAAVPRIVEHLEADDPAVRLLAIAALERLTGRTYDYVHYDPPEKRAAAVERWVAAVESGEIDRLIADRSAGSGRTPSPPDSRSAPSGG